ncbi:MAG TPA: hypothetical protein VN043_05795 [Rhodanobacter sp.]|nr:hypothetical protein [Rhodanobacter sp.]
MKRYLASLALIVVAAALSGCYYDPGYSYVRGSGQTGDAYYGSGSSTYYTAPGYYDGYYGSGYYGNAYYGNAYYGSGYYGCCYGPALNIGIRNRYYGAPRYRSYDHRGHHDDRGRRSHAPYGGRPSSNHPQGDRQPRSSGSQRHGEHRDYRH